MLFRTSGLLILSVFLLSVSGSYSIAESRPAAKNLPQIKKKLANIKGFRSGRFGMKEGEVLKAISKDFKISKNKVRRFSHSLEKTTNLEITVPKILEIGGTAKVNYTFGYKSKKLIQVNVVWGAGIAKKVNSKEIVDLANFLRTHLVKKQYKKEGFVANARMNENQTIVFRGSDNNNRMALLVLTTLNAKKSDDPKNAQKILNLKLSYILDPVKLDILTIKDDDF
jgi:hypothetical protein